MRETVALLMTDVEGSTRWWREEPGAMDLAMQCHAELLVAIQERFGAHRPPDQGEGDSAFLSFASAYDAVAAALDLQIALGQQAWPAPVQLRVRMAVGLGDVLPRQGNLLGDTVNTTARLRALGHGGQILLSSAVRELLRAKSPPDSDVRDLGLHRVKDVPGHQRVWQLLHPDLPDDFAPLQSSGFADPDLPFPYTSFVGREADLADLSALLESGQRLVTVTGFGGIGKTRLLLSLCAQVAARAQPLVWVDLSDATDPDMVPSLVGAALGLRDQSANIAAATTEHLAGRPLLLVLDNVEQVIGCAPYVAQLLSRCPHLTVLAASREPLGLSGEVDFRLQPLPVPTELSTGWEESPAVLLFIDRAVAVDRTFALSTQDAPTLLAICQLLDGMPLALELAAARVRSRSLAPLLTDLRANLPELGTATRDAPARHRTLRDTIAWSFRLLTGPEQALLLRLCALPSHASWDTISAVCRPETPDLLDALVERSFVLREGERFRLLESVRSFAVPLLTANERRSLQDRHLTYFLARSTAGALVADSPLSKAWDAERIDDEAHFRAALAHAHDSGRAHDELTLVANLADLWLDRYLGDGIALFARARTCATLGGVDDLPLLAFSASMQAFLLAWAGDAVTGLPVAEEGVLWAQQPGAESLLPFAHQARAEVQNDVTARRADLERAVDLARATGEVEHRWGGAQPESVELGAGSSLCRLEHYRDPARARATAQELLVRAKVSGRLPDVAGCLLLLSVLAVDTGDLGEAEQQLRDCLSELETVEALAHQRAHAQMLLALVQDMAGEPDIDLAALADELELAGFTSYLLDVLLRLGERHALAGRFNEAREVWQRSVDLALRAGLGRVDWPRWRLLRLARLTGETGALADLETLWTRLRPHAQRFLPEILSALTEAAVIADASGDAGSAARFIGHVRSALGPFVVAPLVQQDLAGLLQRYPGEAAYGELPESLISSVSG